jgi:hypothetical protein
VEKKGIRLVAVHYPVGRVMGCDQSEPYGFASCRLHNWSIRVLCTGDWAQALRTAATITATILVCAG